MPSSWLTGPPGVSHRDDLGAEPARLLGAGRPLVAAQRELVLALPG